MGGATFALDLDDRFRRIYVIPGHFCDGRLTDPTAAARRKPRPARSDRRQGLRPGEPPEGKLDGSEGDKGGEGFGEVLEILGETPVAPEPGEGALDHPAARQHDKAFHVVAPFDDLRAQRGTFATAASTCHAL